MASFHSRIQYFRSHCFILKSDPVGEKKNIVRQKKTFLIILRFKHHWIKCFSWTVGDSQWQEHMVSGTHFDSHLTCINFILHTRFNTNSVLHLQPRLSTITESLKLPDLFETFSLSWKESNRKQIDICPLNNTSVDNDKMTLHV